MAYSMLGAEAQLEFCLFSNQITVVGMDSNRNVADVPRCFWHELPHIDLAVNVATDLSGDSRYTDLTTPKSHLLERFKPRDAYAQKLFERTVWDARMAAHWIKNRTSSGFYDVGRTSVHVDASQSLLDHLQAEKITAVIDGNVVESNVWFAADIKALGRARFERKAVMELFKVDEDTGRIRRIKEALDLLPDGTSKAAAKKTVKEILGESGTMVNLIVEAELRFRSLPRGRPRKKPSGER